MKTHGTPYSLKPDENKTEPEAPQIIHTEPHEESNSSVDSEEQQELKKGNESESDSEEPESDLDSVIKSTFDYVIHHDREEMGDLLEMLKCYVDEEKLSLLMDLEGIIKMYFYTEYIEGDPILPMIDALRNKLEANSSITVKEKLRQLKMLIHDIIFNRDRITQVLKRLDEAENKGEVLKQLWKGNLLSNGQFEELSNRDLDLSVVADVLKKSKVGRGQHFLPRSTDDLVENLHYLEQEAVNKDNVRAIIDELYGRDVFSYEDYNTLVREL